MMVKACSHRPTSEQWRVWMVFDRPVSSVFAVDTRRLELVSTHASSFRDRYLVLYRFWNGHVSQ